MSGSGYWAVRSFARITAIRFHSPVIFTSSDLKVTCDGIKARHRALNGRCLAEHRCVDPYGIEKWLISTDLKSVVDAHTVNVNTSTTPDFRGVTKQRGEFRI